MPRESATGGSTERTLDGPPNEYGAAEWGAWAVAEAAIERGRTIRTIATNTDERAGIELLGCEMDAPKMRRRAYVRYELGLLSR
jgi:hypothetical protein